MTMIGEQFDDLGEYICGGVVNVRNKGDKVCYLAWTHLEMCKKFMEADWFLFILLTTTTLCIWLRIAFLIWFLWLQHSD